MDKEKLILFIKENKAYILAFFIFFIIFIPHYTLNGNYVFIGSYYTPNSAEKKRNEEELIKLTQENTEKLKLTLIESNNKYQQLNDKYKEIEDENIKLKDQVESLTKKLYQQENFFTTKNNDEKEIKKVSFSNVSKKQIRNDRPEFGNSFSKAIKKTKKN